MGSMVSYIYVVISLSNVQNVGIQTNKQTKQTKTNTIAQKEIKKRTTQEIKSGGKIALLKKSTLKHACKQWC
jgi:hypothetical protein